MNKVILAAAITAGFIATTAPASAQVQRCDYYGRCQGSTAPTGGGYDNRYNNGGYYQQPTLVDALVLSLLRPHHKQPTTCYDGHGNLISRNRRKEMAKAEGSEAAQLDNPAMVSAQCGDSHFEAVAQPAKATQSSPAAAPAASSIVVNGVTYNCVKKGGKRICTSAD